MTDRSLGVQGTWMPFQSRDTLKIGNVIIVIYEGENEGDS